MSLRPIADVCAVLALAAMAAFTAACGGGSSSEGGPGPCAGANPAPGCGIACADDFGCGSGFHCEATICTAQCTLGGSQCGSDAVCDGKGHCIPQTPPGDEPDANCPDIEVQAQITTPSVQLLLDQSGSMTQSFGTVNGVAVDRYTAMKGALTDARTGVVTQLADKVIFGASLYTSKNGTTAGGTCPLLQNVPRALNNAAAIATMLKNNKPDDDTPTAESIDAMVASFKAAPPPAGSKPVIVLATDGEPDTCAVPDPKSGQVNLGPKNTVDAAERAFKAGITLYILSVGNEVGAAHLQEMANVGVGLARNSATKAPFFVANNQAELAKQLQTILGNIRSCDLTLDAALDNGVAQQGTVTLGSKTLTFGSDWTQIDDTHIRITGTACQQLLNSDDAVKAVFPCGTVEVD